ncbi:MAG: YifB family Mg chelatase-like AAA ATPase [Candidatus Pacebacteria bacterium]|nr:YifB family Mg chelatase-like AAA ATPase [Candidatus Paceibacterota bacterium]MDD4874894.1 YifB family Mg chelatase-like AAA ATPase [Candidatus Paceibacterota bacterium]
MPVKIFSAAINGLEAQIIEAEIEASYGLRSFNIVGLADKTIQESRERIGSAIKSSGLKSPLSQAVKLLVSLAPAGLKKEGSLYDLPIALGYLLASKQALFKTGGKIIIGELSLNGTLRPIKGALIIASKAKEKGFEEIILPESNAKEASLIKGIKTVGVKSLKDALAYLENRLKISPASNERETAEIRPPDNFEVNMDWIQGQELAKRALEIAASGGHNILMEGPPGTGKTLLAKAMASILPPLSFEESLEVTKIYSASGLLPENSFILKNRPFRSPHHTASGASLIGGGNPLSAGEITLAHRGILFLDEFPEFHRDVLESLRQPMEEGTVSILRSSGRASLPARFTLVAAANPCPCGNFGDPEKECSCLPGQILRYRRKLCGPIMDRIDLFIKVPQIKFERLTAQENRGQSEKIKEKVIEARAVQEERLKNIPKSFTNSEMAGPQIEKFCKISDSSKQILKKAVDSGTLSARGFHKILKVSRTIADLEKSEEIKNSHVMEALMYRKKD